MTSDVILFQNFTPLIIKGFALSILFLYVIFAIVLFRQVQLMNQIVKIVSFSPILLFIALMHLAASIGLFLLALVSL